MILGTSTELTWTTLLLSQHAVLTMVVISSTVTCSQWLFHQDAHLWLSTSSPQCSFSDVTGGWTLWETTCSTVYLHFQHGMQTASFSAKSDILPREAVT